MIMHPTALKSSKNFWEGLYLRAYTFREALTGIHSSRLSPMFLFYEMTIGLLPCEMRFHYECESRIPKFCV